MPDSPSDPREPASQHGDLGRMGAKTSSWFGQSSYWPQAIARLPNSNNIRQTEIPSFRPMERQWRSDQERNLHNYNFKNVVHCTRGKQLDCGLKAFPHFSLQFEVMDNTFTDLTALQHSAGVSRMDNGAKAGFSPFSQLRSDWEEEQFHNRPNSLNNNCNADGRKKYPTKCVPRPFINPDCFGSSRQQLFWREPMERLWEPTKQRGRPRQIRPSNSNRISLAQRAASNRARSFGKAN